MQMGNKHIKEHCDQCGNITAIKRSNPESSDAYMSIIPLVVGIFILLIVGAASTVIK